MYNTLFRLVDEKNVNGLMQYLHGFYFKNFIRTTNINNINRVPLLYYALPHDDNSDNSDKSILTLQILLDHGAYINILSPYIRNRPFLNIRVFKFLIDNGLDIDLGYYISINNNENNNILEKIKIILHNHHCNINNRYNGKTPLMIATQQKLKKIIILLIDHGADMNIRDISGRTAENYASPELLNLFKPTKFAQITSKLNYNDRLLSRINDMYG
jgi:ankyrin repeat protein